MATPLDTPIHLKERESLRVHDGAGLEVRCLLGNLWITEEGERDDTIIDHGRSFVLDRSGLSLVTALGAGFLLSALNTRYRDVPYAIPVFMQVLPFVSAVPYALNEVPLKWQWILSINPISTVVTGWRWCVIGGAPPNPQMTLLSVGVALLLLLGGLAFFRASEPRFADTI